MKNNFFLKLVDVGSEHSFYVSATIISAGIHFLYSVFVKTRIAPFEYGIYSTCLLLQTYMSYIQLGSLNAFNRDYPQLLGSNDLAGTKRCRDTIFTFLLIVFSCSTIFLSIGIRAVGHLLEVDNRYIFGLILCAISTALSVFENFGSSRVRIDGSFKYTSIVIIAELFSVFIGFLLVPLVGYYSLYITTIGSMIIGIILYYKRGFSDLKLYIDKPLLKVMVLSGLPLLINNLVWTVVNSIDKFVILGFINTEALGMYSIAQMAFLYMVLVPNAMSQLFYVKLGKVYGESQSIVTLNEVAIKYTSILSVVVSYIVLFAYFFIGPLVVYLMPSYSPGIKSAQILMLGLAIYAPTIINSNILTILRKNSALLRSSIYLCALNLLFSVVFIVICGANIESVALGTTISYLIRTAILVHQLKIYAGTNATQMLKASVLPVLFTAGPGVIIYNIVNTKITGFAIAFVIAIFITFLLYRKQIHSFVKVVS